jgi:hypothetical protein
MPDRLIPASFPLCSPAAPVWLALPAGRQAHRWPTMRLHRSDRCTGLSGSAALAGGPGYPADCGTRTGLELSEPASVFGDPLPIVPKERRQKENGSFEQIDQQDYYREIIESENVQITLVKKRA